MNFEEYKEHRKRMKEDPNYAEEIKQKEKQDLINWWNKLKPFKDEFTAFAELVGPNSFCGKHHPDDKLDLILFDIWLFKSGWIKPQKFIDDFGHLGIPDVIYKGKLDNQLISDIQEDKFNLSEGVIAKGDDFMVKIKTKNWLKKVRLKLGEKYLMEDLDYNKKLLIV